MLHLAHLLLLDVNRPQGVQMTVAQIVALRLISHELIMGLPVAVDLLQVRVEVRPMIGDVSLPLDRGLMYLPESHPRFVSALLAVGNRRVEPS